MRQLPLFRYRQSAFTIVELVVTLIIVGIMAVSVAPRLDVFGAFDSRGFRDQTIAVFRYAQKSAMAQRRHVCAVIANNDVTLRISSTYLTSPPACTAATSLDSELRYPADNCDAIYGTTNDSRTMCRPRRVAVSLAGGGTIAVLFEPSGRNGFGVTSIAVTDESLITIESETGYVH